MSDYFEQFIDYDKVIPAKHVEAIDCLNDIREIVNINSILGEDGNEYIKASIILNFIETKTKTLMKKGRK